MSFHYIYHQLIACVIVYSDYVLPLCFSPIDSLCNSVRNIAEGQNQNTLLHRLSTAEKHSRRTESEYIITQVINW
jgi:hypothetical protein